MIEVTNACSRRCSNCTRLVGHVPKPYFMDLDCFDRCLEAAAAFLTDSEPDYFGREKVVGVMGGEPQMHPQFAEIARRMKAAIPKKSQRGLWTGEPIRGSEYEQAIQETYGYINHNQHVASCYHQPVLVGVQEVVKDSDEMWRLIDECWLQTKWSCSLTPHGFYFCEVAAALANLAGESGTPLAQDCWAGDLDAYREQIEAWCPRCGVCLPLPGRRDNEGRDDVSPENLTWLAKLGSPRIARGKFVPFDCAAWQPPKDWMPERYLRRSR